MLEENNMATCMHPWRPEVCRKRGDSDKGATVLGNRLKIGWGSDPDGRSVDHPEWWPSGLKCLCS